MIDSQMQALLLDLARRQRAQEGRRTRQHRGARQIALEARRLSRDSRAA
ncbi:hypothetical protein FBY41_1255 [Humibacillus xanthopallidus]|uniref:Uncharacterized protein n=1 Tax=Humibacillus xanthopallidus TaxID=412689 RepID=A0A543I2Q7_9MICO|nr:hypothetical protein FBY41_1255 [Humibacillus xanthopallidus]